MGWRETCTFAAAGLIGLGAARLTRYEVTGTSMAPTLLPGDRLLVWRSTEVRPGQLVLARDPRQPARTMLKRATAVAGRGAHAAVTLHGDHAEASTDSRTFGPVPGLLVLGRVVYRYAPADRAGRGW